MRIFSKSIHSLALFKFKKEEAGFTLTELLVVISIATIIMTALIIQQRKWDDQLALNTQAYELVLMLRQAQIYSLGVRENAGGATGSDKFDDGYGVHVSALNPTQYILFADANKNLKYDVGEAIETKTLTRGITINRVCGIVELDTFPLPIGERCSNDSNPIITLEMVGISFLRPEVNAKSKFLNSSSNEIFYPPSSGDRAYELPATIHLNSPQGRQSWIKIEANGQISTGS